MNRLNQCEHPARDSFILKISEMGDPRNIAVATFNGAEASQAAFAASGVEPLSLPEAF
ncbi:hypothetical protein H6G89_09995 [Oscillatoria sp. FACHB-1407]|uniref:hypothetical protein n=1 Tax=Oscillatoria sp. FACHB-1407 TaxID=2692847 RepID=UPI001686E505|nr:hypothetical protein [Oscillatoria sp. FACHB-1407]MBD2461378.1 hypothetical protein [Oscillatoria sp. FACHB-1407]